MKYANLLLKVWVFAPKNETEVSNIAMQEQKLSYLFPEVYPRLQAPPLFHRNH